MSFLFGSRSGHVPLFNDLCRFHQFDRKTRQLLGNVAQRFQLERPTLMFFDPVWLRKAIGHPDFAESVDDLQTLYNTWFDE